MTLLLLLSAVLFSNAFALPASDAESVKTGFDTSRCLPDGITAADIVSVEQVKPGVSSKMRQITVATKLKQLRARCRRGKLVAANGREIRFYQLQGCWGNPPENYQEILAQQAKELEDLRKRYHVIEMTCNPSGALIH